MTLGKIFSQASRGWFQIRKGVKIISSKRLIEEQSDNGADYSTAPYWVREGRDKIYPIYTGHEILKLLE